MLAPAVVEQIGSLLAVGSLSQRQIARELGISRGTVSAVALGRRRKALLRRADEEPLAPAGLPRRCPGCGGLVQMPCLACRVRQWQRQPRQ